MQNKGARFVRALFLNQKKEKIIIFIIIFGKNKERL